MTKTAASSERAGHPMTTVRVSITNSSSRALNVGIIGGGIGGVAAAVALRRVGIEVTVYERAVALREVGAGMMLWPNATRVLRELGVLQEVVAVSGTSDHFLVRADSGRILMDIPLGHFEVPALCARRSDLLGALISGASLRERSNESLL